MFTLEHRVRVFVFQVLEREIQYLLLRHKPASEWPLGPVVGTVGPHEHLQDAILREVAVETGIRRPLHILELTQPSKELFGDVGLIEWPFAYQAGTPTCPIEKLRPGPMISEHAWLPFEGAFEVLTQPTDRDAIVRLQLHLQAG
jgi:8-oxo-dGTP pyrophosphatase MutT (NUDIX family)